MRLVVEVLGRPLQFDERGGRFNERLELALLTVNDSGRASNGTSIDIDLRLTPEDLARVQGHRRALAVGARIAARPPSTARRGPGRRHRRLRHDHPRHHGARAPAGAASR